MEGKQHPAFPMAISKSDSEYHDLLLDIIHKQCYLSSDLSGVNVC